MDRGSFPFQKKSANKHRHRRTFAEAAVSHWNDERVVPAIVNGKRTYVIISAVQPSDTDERADGVRVLRHYTCTSDSCLQHHKLCTDGAAHSVAAADSNTRKDNVSRKEHDKYDNLSLSGSSNVDDRSMMNLSLTQSCEQQMVVPEKPSTTLLTSGTTVSSTSPHHVPCTRQQSAAAARRRGEHRNKLYTHGAAHSVAAADSNTRKDNDSGKEHDKYGKLSLSGSSSDDDKSMMNLTQSCEQQMVVTEKPSTTLLTSGTTVSSTSPRHVRCTRQQSAAAVRRRGEHRHRLEAATDFLDTDTVILCYSNFLLSCLSHDVNQ